MSVFTERLQHACCQPRVAWLAARYARGEEFGAMALIFYPSNDRLTHRPHRQLDPTYR